MSPPVELVNTNNRVIRVPPFFLSAPSVFPVRTISYKMRELNKKLATVTKYRPPAIAQKKQEMH